MNFFKTVSKLTAQLCAGFALVTTMALSDALPSQAKPQGEFGITTNNGLRVDIEYEESYKSKVHLYKDKTISNVFALGPTETSGNELRLASKNFPGKKGMCITPDTLYPNRPEIGTNIIAIQDCNEAFNWKFNDNGSLYLGKYPDLCMDIPNNNDKLFIQLKIHPCNGSAAQQFNTGNISNESSTQPTAIEKVKRDGNFYTGPIVGNNSGFNGPKFLYTKGRVPVKYINNNCSRYIDSVKWIYRAMYQDPITGLYVFDWSLNIIPSECGRTSRLPTPWKSWEELVTKTPYNFEGTKVAWNKQWNTSQYWSMYNQYVCHTDFASLTGKYDYNLEPGLPDVGYEGMRLKECNPEYTVRNYD
jgi:hypothetical protein